MTPLLSARGLRRTYGPGPGALDGVDLDVGEDATVGLVGRSGSGKSTLLRLLLALEAPDAGSVHCLGRPIRPAGARHLRWFRRTVQYVPQDPATSLDPRATAVTSVLEPLRRLGAHGSARDHEHRARHCLEQVGIDVALHGRRPGELSGGQAQRVALARALAVRPRLLIADEPVSGLDLPLRAQVVQLLQEVCSGGLDPDGTALLVVSHDISVVAALCGRTVVMDAGRVVEDRPTAELLTRPGHPRTRQLLEAVPRLRRTDAPLTAATSAP
ncbi:ABC transporter ATP-binding protein [Aquipuribacter sp. MA13-6]|uniref:ABC transporter ATP-binding protein n=1 Tax=unclassified Aquipuribacter TaxID=2635084 RepID=UPI003EEF90CE